jgi:hypothetical protein
MWVFALCQRSALSVVSELAQRDQSDLLEDRQSLIGRLQSDVADIDNSFSHHQNNHKGKDWMLQQA